MVDRIDDERRRFLGTAAMTMAAAPFGMLGRPEAAAAQSRELTALVRATEWLNSPRPTPSSLAGKVVLVDFCTYTCINWLRTLPYVRAWAQKYGQGLVVIGVHTPEFSFEHELDNVRRAIRQMTIEYPVVIDNDYAIWRAFNNNAWPALYFMDARGRVRQHHLGEGGYAESEMAIQRLLADAGVSGIPGGTVSVDGVGIEATADWANLRSGENYLGADRTQNFASPGGARVERRHVYAAPSRLTLNHWALVGEWTTGREKAALHSAQGRIAYRFHARDLHLVMGPGRRESPVRFRVTIDGQPPGAAHGSDVDESGRGMAHDQRVYQLIRQQRPIADRTFEIEFLDTGVEAFAFTFG